MRRPPQEGQKPRPLHEAVGQDPEIEIGMVALLGNVALRFPHETLAWDGKRMRFPDRPEANAYLSSPVRAG